MNQTGRIKVKPCVMLIATGFVSNNIALAGALKVICVPLRELQLPKKSLTLLARPCRMNAARPAKQPFQSRKLAKKLDTERTRRDTQPKHSAGTSMLVDNFASRLRAPLQEVVERREKLPKEPSIVLPENVIDVQFRWVNPCPPVREIDHKPERIRFLFP
jgi:hypothetical protein